TCNGSWHHARHGLVSLKPKAGKPGTVHAIRESGIRTAHSNPTPVANAFASPPRHFPQGESVSEEADSIGPVPGLSFPGQPRQRPNQPSDICRGDGLFVDED